jgi:SagB-type dehydrogenase family enzyme
MLVAATSSRPLGALNEIYLVVNAVDQLPSGSYVYHPPRQALELLRAGNFRPEATHLDLGQELAGDASVNFYMLADLEGIFARYGNRGYRAAQLDGAIIGGRLYLATYALGLGATGLTFFDDDVTEFFSPHAAGKSVMFLVAAGARA